MIASLIQNTSMTIDKIKDLTIAELEDLFEGFEENNKKIKDLSNDNKKVLEGQEAINFLINSGGKL